MPTYTKPNYIYQANDTAYIGQTEEGGKVALTIKNAPHVLIAGVTGSGKSVMMRALLTGLIANSFPDETAIYILDPKRVDYIEYRNCPHIKDICTTDKAMLLFLERINNLMDKRLAEMMKTGQKDLKQSAKMPRIYIFCDELADLTGGLNKKMFNYYLIRLAQMGRAAGIHLVLATQRPSAAVLPCQLRDNIPCRISLKVMDKTAARMIGVEGAEELGYKGDAIIKLADGRTAHFQGYLSPDEAIIQHAIEQTKKPERMGLFKLLFA